MELPKILGFVGVGLAGLTTLFVILALALPSWRTAENVEIGIWEYCTTSAGNRVCVDIVLDDTDGTDTATNTRAVRAMCFLGLFCIIGALVAAILKLFVMKSNKIVGFVAGGVAILAGFWLMVGFAVYADKLSTPYAGIDFDYGAAFALDVVAWLLAWVAGGLFLAETLMGGGD